MKLTNKSFEFDGSCVIEDIVQNGVKETKMMEHDRATYHAHFNQKEGTVTPMTKVQDVINDGVKETMVGMSESILQNVRINRVLNNGVKQTKTPADGDIESTLEWIKENNYKYPPNLIDDVIENGVKETKPALKKLINPMDFNVVIQEEKRIPDVSDVLENGIKKVKAMDEWVNTDYIVNKVMVDGIKEIQPLPAQDGNRDWGLYYNRKGVPTKPHTEYVKDVISFGEKKS